MHIVEADTTEPSPFAHPLLFGYTSTLLYQEDLPHAEHRARLLSLDPQVLDTLLGDGGLAGLLDDEVMAEVEAELQHLASGRRARADAEGIADLLRELGPLTDTELVERCEDTGDSGGDDVQEDSGVANGLPAAVRSAVDGLADAGRA